MLNRKFFSLLVFKTAANLHIEVSKYYLNYFWWLLEPVLTMGVFYVVFGIFLDRGTEHFVAFLLCGLTSWNWFNRTVQNAAASIEQGHGLMMQVNIPKVFFPLEIFLRDAFKHLFVLVLLLVFLIFYPTPVTMTWAFLPVLLLVQGVFVLGVAVLVAALVPFLPDLKLIISTALTLMFFGSGVFFSIEDVVLKEHQAIIYLNPMAGLIKAHREILIYGQWPNLAYLFSVLLVAVVLLWAAVRLVRHFEHTYPRLN